MRLHRIRGPGERVVSGKGDLYHTDDPGTGALRWALETAREGKSVAMLCSGDAGVYGMAGPLLQLTEGGEEVEITVVPGVTAALSGAAMLGAPLMHDFCVISLSDLHYTLGPDCQAAGVRGRGGQRYRFVQPRLQEAERASAAGL